MTVIYHGHRHEQEDRCTVTRWDSREGTASALDYRLDLRWYSPIFDWGHGGPAAAQLALALLADAVGDEAARTSVRV